MDDVTQAFTSLQAATQLIKALMGVRDAAVIDSKMIELRDHLINAQNSIFESQAQQSTLIQRVHDLEKELMSIKAWEKEKERYQLIEPWRGCFLYALKEASKGTEPPHWICAQCYQEGRKSLLQNTYKNNNHRIVFVKCSHS